MGLWVRFAGFLCAVDLGDINKQLWQLQFTSGDYVELGKPSAAHATFLLLEFRASYSAQEQFWCTMEKLAATPFGSSSLEPQPVRETMVNRWTDQLFSLGGLERSPSSPVNIYLCGSVTQEPRSH